MIAVTQIVMVRRRGSRCDGRARERQAASVKNDMASEIAPNGGIRKKIQRQL
jgi:hypothetical protein